MSLHQKLDALRLEQWNELLIIQQDQSKTLKQLAEDIHILKENQKSALKAS